VKRGLSVDALPAPLHRLLLRIAHWLRSTWWRWRQPVVLGVSIIARDEAGRVLLIRQSYGSSAWQLPGGGLHKGEDPAAAAAREFEEELGCPIADLTILVVRDEKHYGATNRVHVFTGRLAGEPKPDGREVIAARLFALDALPPDLGRRAWERFLYLP
jgi:8-oxo-dGTP pyrophosphatase MutT (NUDIX family)